MSYHDELRKAMAMVAAHPGAIFMGQGVAVPGTSMHSTFSGVPQKQRIEMPVAEELQMGMAIGMALQGFLPVTIFPRWNFVLRAADQIVNHLDRLPIYSGGDYRPRVILRTAVPSVAPFNPQSQHDDDFTVPFRLMCRTIKIVALYQAEEIIPAYLNAVESDGSTFLIEFTEYYKNERASL